MAIIQAAIHGDKSWSDINEVVGESVVLGPKAEEFYNVILPQLRTLLKVDDPDGGRLSVYPRDSREAVFMAFSLAVSQRSPGLLSLIQVKDGNVVITDKGEEFFDLAEEALEAGPVKPGPYKDGAYHAEQTEYSNGFRYYVNILVVNGSIRAVDWNAYAEEEGAPDKDTLSRDGGYPIVERGGAQAPWHEQAMAAEAYLIETQDPTDISYTDDEGHTDAISGVSIHVVEFFELAEEALASAR